MSFLTSGDESNLNNNFENNERQNENLNIGERRKGGSLKKSWFGIGSSLIIQVLYVR